MERLLIVDDDPGTLTLLRRGFTLEGFAVDAAPHGEAALALARERAPDLAVLDLMLPGLGGLDLLARLRAADSRLPVVLLTARDRPDEQVAGLEAGADDYVTKPFSFDVLAARVRALLRRRGADRPEVLRFADLTLHPAAHTARRGVRDITLTAQEYRVLQVFVEHAGRVLSKPLLLDLGWGLSYLGDANVVETYVKQLRQKLEKDGEPRLIHTIRGVGYVLREG